MASITIWHQLAERWKSFVPPRPIHSPAPANYPGGRQPEGVRPRPYTNPNTVPNDWHDVRGRPMQPPRTPPYSHPIIILVGTGLVLSEAIQWLEEALNPIDAPSTADFERELERWITSKPLGGQNAANDQVYNPGSSISADEVDSSPSTPVPDVLDLQDPVLLENVPPPIEPDPYGQLSQLTASLLGSLYGNITQEDDGSISWPSISPDFTIPTITIQGNGYTAVYENTGPGVIRTSVTQTVEKPGITHEVTVPSPEVPKPQTQIPLSEIHAPGLDLLEQHVQVASRPKTGADAIAQINEQIGTTTDNLAPFTADLKTQITNYVINRLVNEPDLFKQIEENVSQLIETQIDNTAQTVPEVMPEVAVDVGTATPATPTTSVPQVQIQVATRPQSITAENTLRKDSKTKSQLIYLSGLNLVNKTWGPISELKDFIDIFFDNVTVSGRSGHNLTWEQLFQAVQDGEAELDVDQFLVDLVVEELLDTYIGALSQLEKNALLDALPPSHPLLNMYGNPSTWARRLGHDLWNTRTTSKALKSLGEINVR